MSNVGSLIRVVPFRRDIDSMVSYVGGGQEVYRSLLCFRLNFFVNLYALKNKVY